MYKISELKDKRILIFGLGKEGLSAVRLLGELFPEKQIFIYDEKQDLTKIDKNDFGKIEVEIVINLDFDYDVIIKSPGVSLYNNFFTEAREKGIVITSGTNLFFADILSKSKRPKLIGITGTKGKSTTASLTAYFLNALGKKTALAGNIGTPLLDLFGKVDDFDYVVIEMSSFQTADLAYPLDVAYLNNLHSEHLDWHLSEENYHLDKLNIFLTKRLAGGDVYPAVAIMNKLDVYSDKFADKVRNIFYSNDETAIHVVDGDIYDGKNLIVHSENIKLLGAHNKLNLAGVATILKVLGEDLGIIDEIIADFVPLKHRLEVVCERDGITYIDDSISTTPVAAVSALNVFNDRQVTILLGGFDRGLDYSNLVKFLACRENVKVVCMPDMGRRIYENLSRVMPEQVFFVEGMVQAVRLAQEITESGGIILLSPAAPSFNAYKNFEERGDDFRKCVASL